LNEYKRTRNNEEKNNFYDLGRANLKVNDFNPFSKNGENLAGDNQKNRL